MTTLDRLDEIPGDYACRALLRQAIEASGLSMRKYARTVLIREERTIKRWMSGESPIPQRVREWLIEARETATPPGN